MLSIDGLFVSRLQEFHTLTVEVNGALMVGPRDPIWRGGRYEVR